MSIAEALSLEPNSTRAKILSDVNPDDFSWALPIMRAGYAGRGLVYLVVAGVSLWSVAQGGQAQGTKSAMQSMGGGIGTFLVVCIAAGMFAYAIWRLIDCIWDLEAYGTDAKGIIARAGMTVTGLVHAGIGVIAITALGFASSGSGGKSMLTDVLHTQTGAWAVGIAGVLTVATGFYYLYKAAAQTYREHLRANQFTLHWNPLLRAGVAAQGVSIAIIGGLIIYAALQADASDAGGLGSAFEWLHAQAYGRILVAVLCVGLLGFSLFCFVNAAYRIIPKAADDSVQNITARLKQKASDAMS